MYFDPLYFVFALPALVLVFFAQWRVKSTYSKYAKVANMARASGAEVAQRLLHRTTWASSACSSRQGELTDHYNPADKTLNLSARAWPTRLRGGPGHRGPRGGARRAGRHRLRPHAPAHALVPVANLGSNLGYILFFLGLVLQFTGLV